MATRIQIVDGTYNIRGKATSMAGLTFDLVDEYTDINGYVVVDGASVHPAFKGLPDRKLRIKCDGVHSYNVVSGDAVINLGADNVHAIPAIIEESDEDIIARTRQRFEILDEMTRAVKQGTIRAMIVSGPPGVGKSFGVESVLSKEDLFNKLANRAPKYEVVKGAMSPVGLYKKLYEMSDDKCVLVFDDCDSVLLDDLSLNILKAALDTSRKRMICWNTDSRLLRQEGIPDKFEFKGAAIFITNIKFENVRSKKLQDHLAALESRCHYVDLKMDTTREKILRIKQIVLDGMLESYQFTSEDQETIVDFIVEHQNRLRELSLRTVLKVADLYKSFPEQWDNMAKVTVMKHC